MTYVSAKSVKIGDTLRAKDGYLFTVEKIEEKTDEANINNYLVFKGTCDRGFLVHYDHKKIKYIAN